MKSAVLALMAAGVAVSWALAAAAIALAIAGRAS